MKKNEAKTPHTSTKKDKENSAQTLGGNTSTLKHVIYAQVNSSKQV